MTKVDRARSATTLFAACLGFAGCGKEPCDGKALGAVPAEQAWARELVAEGGTICSAGEAYPAAGGERGIHVEHSTPLDELVVAYIRVAESDGWRRTGDAAGGSDAHFVYATKDGRLVKITIRDQPHLREGVRGVWITQR